MQPKQFVNELQREEILAAISAAELKTSGEVRVFICEDAVETPVKAAEAEFIALGMEKTRDRNGVLIFVAPASQNFAVVGDSGIHARCGKEFWERIAEEMAAEFKKGQFTKGIVRAVGKAGELLAQNFPRSQQDRNELPDEVRFGRSKSGQGPVSEPPERTS